MALGLLTYHTTNLGDEIQSIAARCFLPRVDMLLDRDGLDRDPGEAVHMILNGWLVEGPVHWPPHDAIRPLPVSFHLNTKRPYRRRFWKPAPSRAMLKPAGLEWFARHAPIGARDRATQALLQRHGIASDYTGCLTLTLPEAPGTREDLIVACDLPVPMIAALRRRTRSPIETVSHIDTVTTGHDARMARAQALLDLYARARAVVTSRLHCALPCLAMGTPVLFVPVEHERGRQQPGLDHAHVATAADLLAGRDGFDLDAPPPNREDWRPRAEDLAERCRAFVAAAEAPHG